MLECLLKLLTNEKALAYYEICNFTVDYESVMFYSTGPWPDSETLQNSSRPNTLAYLVSSSVRKKKVLKHCRQVLMF
jgi:hypothetical protein